MPLRDGRRGNRATLSGNAPLRPVFPATERDAGGDTVPSAIPARFATAPQVEALALGAHGPRAELTTDDEPIPESDGVPTDDAPVAAAKAAPAVAVRTRFGLRTLAAAFARRRQAADESPIIDALADANEAPSAAVDEDAFAAEVLRASAVMPDVAPLAAEEPPFASPASDDDEREAGEAVAARGADAFVASDERPLVDASTHDRAPRERSRPPLTRLPLRPRTAGVSWPLLLGADNGAWGEAARHDFLRGVARQDPDAGLERAIATAVVEETAPGRVLALRALARHGSAGSRAVFLDALRRGGDEERAVAVDVFAERGDREALLEALSDRLDAIAARAALAYFAGATYRELEAALVPLVDRSRSAAILALLAGVMT